jgi:hypothetical protein
MFIAILSNYCVPGHFTSSHFYLLTCHLQKIAKFHAFTLIFIEFYVKKLCTESFDSYVFQ